MKVFDLKQKYQYPIVLSLGFFDCIHIGHKSLIETANAYAKAQNAASFVMTFSSDPSLFFGKSKQIYTFEDRLTVLENLGVDGVISAEFDSAFANIMPNDFLDMLFESYNIKAVVVGADYTFGCHADGNVEYLQKYCDFKGIKVIVVPFECANGQKLSTKNLKSFVEQGDVQGINRYLSEPYFMSGTVKSAKHNGTRIGFPTANILQNDDRLALKDGVYATKVMVDGSEYISMTNVGAKPTFNDFSASVETHIIGFDGDLYGKTVKIVFYARMRDIKSFATTNELCSQLNRDEQFVKDLFLK